jgi:hypothetical protein
MSMIVTTVAPDGIVMAADSALLSFKFMDMINLEKGNIQEVIKNTLGGTCAYDKKNIVGKRILTRSASKLHIMKGNNIAIADGNQRNAGKESTNPHIDHFCNNSHYDDPKSCAADLLNLVKNLEQNISAIYHVCGYNPAGKIPSPEFWYVDVKNNIVMNGMGETQYGISFCGANEYFSQYAMPISKEMASYSLQDAIDVTLFAIEMSIKLERFIDRDELISPPIDLLVIEPSGVKWIQQKTLRGGL